MNKQLLFGTTAALSVFLFTCGTTFGDIPQNVKTERFEEKISGFNQIQASSIYEIYLVQGDTEKVEIVADERVRPLVEVSKKGDALVLGIKDGKQSLGKYILKAYVTVKSLEQIRLSGSAEIEFVSPMKVSSLKITLSGAAKMDSEDYTLTAVALDMDMSGASKAELKLDVQTLKAEVSGAAKMDAEGKAVAMQVKASGAAKIEADELKVDALTADISGAAKMEAWVSATLDAKVSGAGKLEYKGNPQTGSSKASGAGKIVRDND